MKQLSRVHLCYPHLEWKRRCDGGSGRVVGEVEFRNVPAGLRCAKCYAMLVEELLARHKERRVFGDE